MKKIFLIVLFSIWLSNVFSQETNRKIYFLADTINTPKNNQVLRIETISFFEYSFIFYCKCAYPYKSYVSFSYLTTKKGPKAEIVSKMPNYAYISFKELMEVAAKHHRYFDNSYDLYITEVLPNNKYRTNKVKFNIYPEPINDGVIIKQK
ncbi:hypothetical protein GM921_13935 [Pedobacter sp. LMG 31464]|uniref:Uncharacterized protein n=1 Tax=Pedobacter planticolens TaxID=2679964 RepID=A0A923E202_9SPHI|nr:hypothetical protein [Pedobacter planticolens]MBB2146598.1 hypothetical protein [Pedobacter planticolens]